MSNTDPDPWCEEADGQYQPPAEPEVITVQADIYDRWNDEQREG